MNANDNIGMKMCELVMWISEFQLYTWVMLNSLVFRITDYVGSQWAIYITTVVVNNRCLFDGTLITNLL